MGNFIKRLVPWKKTPVTRRIIFDWLVIYMLASQMEREINKGILECLKANK
ncbi:hypothetical protein [Enterobacter phage vB-EclM_KMB17]|nr:hypothetical protein [Enterobacter phage vB-EclM_KMB17]